MAGEMRIPVFTIKRFCKNRGSGCPARLYLNELAMHDEECEYRVYPCPYPVPSCNWTGTSDRVHRHLFFQHKIPSWNGDRFIIFAKRINMRGPLYWVVPLTSYGQPFVVIIGKQKRGQTEQCFIMIRLVGSRGLCKKFSCRFELTGRTDDEIKRIWNGPPQNVFDEPSSIILNNTCFLF